MIIKAFVDGDETGWKQHGVIDQCVETYELKSHSDPKRCGTIKTTKSKATTTKNNNKTTTTKMLSCLIKQTKTKQNITTTAKKSPLVLLTYT